MARFDELPPDQRAALQLLLRQRRSYDEIAQLLRIDAAAVQERARAGLDALGPEGLEGLSLEEQDDIADYLLGQQSASRRAATRELLESSGPGRGWARAVASELREVAPDALPDVPAEPAESAQAFDALQARSAHRERLQRSSRIGGAILLAGLAIIVAVILVLVLGGDGNQDADRTETAATETTSTSPQVEAQINLTPPQEGSDAVGVAQIARQGDRRAVALVAQGLQRATRNRFYAIWLYTSRSRARFLGFPNPQPDRKGRIETGFSLPSDASRYRSLVVTRETEERPSRPGTIVLRGDLQGTGG